MSMLDARHAETLKIMMRWRAKVAAACAITLIFGSLAAAQTSAGVAQLGDADAAEQLWGIFGVTTPITSRVDVNAGGGYIGGARAALGIVELPVKLNKHLTLSPGYFYIGAPPVAGRKYREHRLRLSVIPHFNVGRVTFDDRNALERRFRTVGNQTRYRNRLRVSVPVFDAERRFSIVAYDEAIYDFTSRAWSRNIISVGASKTFERLTTELSYVRQNDQNRGDANAVLLTMVLQLGGNGKARGTRTIPRR